MDNILKNSKLLKLAAIYEKDDNYNYKLYFDIDDEKLKELLLECNKNVKFYFCDEKLEKCNKHKAEEFIVIDHNIEKDIFFIFQNKGMKIKVFNKIGKILDIKDIFSKIEYEDILKILKWLKISYEIYKIIEKIPDKNSIKISNYFDFLYSHIEQHKIFSNPSSIENFWSDVLEIEDKNLLFDVVQKYFRDYIGKIDEKTHIKLINFLIKNNFINKIDTKLLYDWLIIISGNENIYNHFITSLVNEKNKINKNIWDVVISINNKTNKPEFSESTEIKDGYNVLYKNIKQQEFFMFLKKHGITGVENLCLYNVIDCSENEVYNNIIVLYCPQSVSEYYVIYSKNRTVFNKNGNEVEPEDILIFVHEPILSFLIKNLNLKKDYYYLKNIFDINLRKEYIKNVNMKK